MKKPAEEMTPGEKMKKPNKMKKPPEEMEEMETEPAELMALTWRAHPPRRVRRQRRQLLAAHGFLARAWQGKIPEGERDLTGGAAREPGEQAGGGLEEGGVEEGLEEGLEEKGLEGEGLEGEGLEGEGLEEGVEEGGGGVEEGLEG